MKNHFMRSIFLITFCLFLAACTFLQPVKTAPVNVYTLSAVGSSLSKSVSSAQEVLLVTTPLATPAYQTTNMIYTQRPFELKNFANNRWAAPPAEMLAPLLVQNLQASGCLHAVVAPPFSGNADLILDTRLLNLQQEFKEHASQVRLALQLTLYNNATHQVIKNQMIEVVVPAENNPYAGVIAANKATGIMLEKLRKLVCQR